VEPGKGDWPIARPVPTQTTNTESTYTHHTSISVVQTTIPLSEQQTTVLALDHAVSIFARLLLRN